MSPGVSHRSRSGIAALTLATLAAGSTLSGLAAPQPKKASPKPQSPILHRSLKEPERPSTRAPERPNVYPPQGGPKTRTPENPNTASVQYNRDIRPILSDNCFACHGPDKNTRMANLRLDLREEAVRHGALVPGKPEASALVARINSADPDLLMPPVASHKKLTPTQKQLLRRWIAEGAKYEAHWAYTPIRRPEVPKLTDPRYAARNPVDAFVRAKLAAQKILPSPEADRRTLLRRVYLDLVGIPPTPEEVRTFIEDRSPDAYEKVVDRLLASPHYGERMAAPWLDVVRYSDTVGFHGDQNQNAWAYRDYVIDSFNRDKPFDQFTMEQIAGDLLPNPTPEQLTATCFNRLTMMTREGGAQPKEYLLKYQGDRVRTVGMAWLGVTLGCAECHDHKFDPIRQKDFYSLSAFFADMRQWGVYADYSYTPNPDLRGYNNDYPFPPEIKVESRYLKERIRRQRTRIDEIALGIETELRAEAAQRAYEAWRTGSVEFLNRHPDGWSVPVPEAKAGLVNAPKPKAGAEPPRVEIEVGADRSIRLADPRPVHLEVRLRPEVRGVAAVRLELLPDASNGGSIFRPGVESATLSLSASVTRGEGKPQPVSFRHAGANFAEPRYSSGFEIVGVHGGWKLGSTHQSEPHVSVWLPAVPLNLAPGDVLTFNLRDLKAAKVRFAVSPFVPEDPDSPALPAGLKAALENPTPPARKALALRTYLLATAWNKTAFERARAVEADLLACRDGITPVMVTEATEPMTIRLLPRGNWQDESGPIVQPAVPAFLPGYQANPGRRLTRLDLAKWLVSPENPLTARVFVNRLWKQFFGNGLSGVVEDLGAQGEWPTHPELLDYLASRFAAGAGNPQLTIDNSQLSIVNSRAATVRGDGFAWRIKPLVKLIVTSATYRQSSNLRPELRDLDPNNRLLASQNPRRLEAEFVRDNALAIVGLLNRDLGGPPVKPYQPEGYYANLQFPNRPYVAETDERQWRRGIYVHWQRTFLHPMLVNFDAPSREDCIAARTVANTPQQALTLLNDPSYVEAARVFGASLLASTAKSDAERLDRAYLRALARPAKAKEKQSMLDFLEKVRASYRERPEDAKKLMSVGYAPVPANLDPVELAAWTTVGRVLLNLQETITRY